jgi:peptidase M23-like protein
MLGLAAGAAVAQTGKPPARIVFPVVGEAKFENDFGDPRPQGRHGGIDIVAPRRAIAVAAEGGTVQFPTTSRAGGCMLYLKGRSGTTYLYIHLNNDLTAANDNRGRCVAGTAYAKGLRNGTAVGAGQAIAYVGDSGDANGAHPHLHFELHPGGGEAANPYPYLRRASRLLFSAPLGSTFTLALVGTVVSVGVDLLRLNVARLRQWPGSLPIRVGRTLTVAVPPEATVERKLPSLAAAPELTELLPGQLVTVFTEPAAVTMDAQRGVPGVLTAARVVLPASR